MGTTFGVIGGFIAYVFIFAFVITLAYFSTKFIASRSLGRTNGRNLKLIESLGLSTQKSIHLIKVGKKYVLLAMSKDNMVNLGSYDEENFEFKEEPDQNTNTNVNFNDVLKNVFNKTKIN